MYSTPIYSVASNLNDASFKFREIELPKYLGYIYGYIRLYTVFTRQGTVSSMFYATIATTTVRSDILP